MDNRVQQRFDRSIRQALAVRHASIPRTPRQISAALVAAAADEKAETHDRRGWKLRIDPATGATIWGPAQ